jgi:cell division protein FtsN
MTDDPKLREENSVTPEDDRLVKELALYRQAESLDSPEDLSEVGEDPALYYKILQIHPDASLSDIHRAFEKITSAWDPERYPHVSSWKETSTKKLKEINNAYERLLLLHETRQTTDPEDSIDAPSSMELASFPADPDPEETTPVRPNARAFSVSTLKNRPWLLAPAALIAITLLLIFLWPTFYHYEAIQVAGKDYPLRINRLTANTQYFDGRQWIEPPLRVATPRHVPPGMELHPSPAQPADTGGSRESMPNLPAPIKDISTQEALPAAPVQTTGIGIPSEPKPASPPPAKRKTAPPDQIGVKKGTGSPFSIQLGAYPERSKAEALAKEMQAKKFAVRVETVSIQGKGRWYRVLLGQFENRAAALRYLKDHRIEKTYPGAFIQKSI